MRAEWITMETLGTFGGVVFAVTVICQFFKGTLDRMVRIPTRLTVLLISFLVLLGRRLAFGADMTAAGLFLDMLNSFLVALTAMGAHAIAKDNLKWK
ncbi:MAG TPA: hypothetical protein VK464_22695 [Symbiobacteriaceae bacterium]|nr:hypothetical protein [Symbiobacteriaceae bacterium]